MQAWAGVDQSKVPSGLEESASISDSKQPVRRNLTSLTEQQTGQSGLLFRHARSSWFLAYCPLPEAPDTQVLNGRRRPAALRPPRTGKGFRNRLREYDPNDKPDLAAAKKPAIGEHYNRAGDGRGLPLSHSREQRPSSN